MNNQIDCTDFIENMATAIAAKLGNATVVILHCPWDSEIGTLYFDDSELPEINSDDILVTVIRKRGESNSSWASRIAAQFEAAI